MPVTHNNLWNKVVSFENFYEAYNAAARGKRFKTAVLNYRRNLEENIINAINELSWKRWEPSRYREFYIHDPKKRLISAPPFKDRVVHHALVQVITPLFERKFISDSFACRTSKGTHAAKERVEEFAAVASRTWGEYYVLKADISGFFYNIDRQVLIGLIERTISDRDVLWLVRGIVACDGDERGIPIGALTSQIFANIYLNELDHYAKDTRGVKMYARYMDDFVVIHRDKEYLQALLSDIRRFLSDRLKLELNPKTGIFRSGRGECHAIDFCGYRIWPDHTKPRKRTVKASRKRLKKLSERYSHGEIALDRLRSSVMSFLGYMKHCSGTFSLESVLASVKVKRNQAEG